MHLNSRYVSMIWIPDKSLFRFPLHFIRELSSICFKELQLKISLRGTVPLKLMYKTFLIVKKFPSCVVTFALFWKAFKKFLNCHICTIYLLFYKLQQISCVLKVMNNFKTNFRLKVILTAEVFFQLKFTVTFKLLKLQIFFHNSPIWTLTLRNILCKI